MTLPVYQMPPPNEDVNFSDITLEEVRTVNAAGKSIHICADALWKPTPYQIVKTTTDNGKNINEIIPGDAVRPIVWDGRIFSDIVRRSRSVVAVLEEMQDRGFPLVLLSKLRSILQRAFDAHYFREHNLNTSRRRDELALHNLVGEHNEHLFQPLTKQQELKAKMGFQRYLQIVAQWCMADFSVRRHLWCSLNSTLNISSEIEDKTIAVPVQNKTGELVVPKVKIVQERKPTKRELRAAKLAKMTPEQRRCEKLREKNARLFKQLVREGKVDEETALEIECWE